MEQKRFNLRVYGLLFNKKKEILICEEYHKDLFLRKFPGGGLHFGEGTIETLKREFAEELQLEISTAEHFYTTDFFVQSVFNAGDQILSFYYLVTTSDLNHAVFSATEYIGKEGEKFTWVTLQELNPEKFTLPIDQKVAELIKKRFNN